MEHQSSISPDEDPSWVERQTLRVLGSFLPRSARRRQIHEWQDQLDCTRATDGNPRRELVQVVRSAPSIAWTAVPSVLRVGLPALAVAMMATLALWPWGTSPLVDQKLRSLASTARAYTPFIAEIVRNNGSADEIDTLVAQVSELSNSRVTLLSVGDGTEGLQPLIFSDSTSKVAIPDLKFAIARDAARTGRTATATESSEQAELGQVAEPIRDEGTVSRVAVFSTPLPDVQGNAALIHSQILVAGALGLLLGLAVAWTAMPSFLRVSLPALAVAMMATLALWPRGTSPLVDQKLNSLASTARAYTPIIAEVVRHNGSAPEIDTVVKQVSERSNSRVTLLSVGDGTGLQPTIFSDSTSKVAIPDLKFAIARDAARTGRTTTGTESSDQAELGQVAKPIRDEGTVSRVAVFSTPMSDVQGSVALIRRQILVTGALGLLLGLAGGFIVSGSMSRRVRDARGQRTARRTRDEYTI